jgi:hypothetical protein
MKSKGKYNNRSKKDADKAMPDSANKKTITLSDEEKATLKALETNLAEAKMTLANAQMQIMALEEQRVQIARKVVEVQNSFMDRVNDLAKDYGIDVTDPTKGRWDLNTATGVFSLVE